MITILHTDSNSNPPTGLGEGMHNTTNDAINEQIQ